jgi:glycogen debranching enzyme
MHTQVRPVHNRPRIADDFDAQVRREWLLTNGRGGFASGTVVGVPTRRYHGLLVASARPPLERWLLLSAMLERVTVNGRKYELANFEFDHAIHPHGFEHETDFATSNNLSLPWVRFVYQHEVMRLTKRIVLPKGRDEVWIHYRLEGPPGAQLTMDLMPYVAMRDFHGLTRAFEGGFRVQESGGAVSIDAGGPPRLWIQTITRTGNVAPFERQPDWWYGFFYRQEAERGQDCHEDLFTPGFFSTSATGVIELSVRAVADFAPLDSMPPVDPALAEKVADDPAGDSAAPASRPAVTQGSPRAKPLPTASSLQTAHDGSVIIDEQLVDDRLVEAADAFIVARRRADGTSSTTILAGYHWFGDWGRDAFIALPGLLLETGRFAEARKVLETFASAQQDGLIPNRFSDYGDGCDYNSVDASLWFVHAATLYCELSGDDDSWRTVLGPACRRVIDAFVAGTRYSIHMDVDGLVACGDPTVQLTWMDAKCGDVVFTPRNGKPVEINALWYHDLCALAQRVRTDDPTQAADYTELAARVKSSFARSFWNEASRCLYDVVRDRWSDRAIRPNQIFAVSLPHSPLSDVQQRAVLSAVECELLTPYGLRSLSWRDPVYRRRYEGDSFQRDSSYHQGTVWGWLIGPYVEAYLRLHDFSTPAKARMRERLLPLIAHLDEACIGSVSEIFDGDEPHTPRGAVAQAWSVAELLRAWRMTSAGRQRAARVPPGSTVATDAGL